MGSSGSIPIGVAISFLRIKALLRIIEVSLVVIGHDHKIILVSSIPMKLPL